MERKVDKTGLKTGMASTIILLMIAFVLDSWVLVAFVAAAQLLGAMNTPFAPYRLFYHHIIKPLAGFKPHIILDNPEPHQFAMLVGGIFNAIATVSLLNGIPLLGWVLTLIVIALANLNFWLDFCLGCWMYYQFNRLGIPGFAHTRIGK